MRPVRRFPYLFSGAALWAQMNRSRPAGVHNKTKELLDDIQKLQVKAGWKPVRGQLGQRSNTAENHSIVVKTCPVQSSGSFG